MFKYFNQFQVLSEPLEREKILINSSKKKITKENRKIYRQSEWCWTEAEGRSNKISKYIIVCVSVCELSDAAYAICSSQINEYFIIDL